VDIIIVRTFEHREVEDLARFASIPVINGLTDLFHPCQILSDLFTIQEYFGDLRKVKISYIGDGNNVAHSWLNAAGVMGLNLWIACPQGYAPHQGIFNKAQELTAASGGRIELTSHPQDAILDADVIYTDVWVSMGQEKDAEEKLAEFSGFQVNQKLIEHANPKAIVMHCLPAHRGEEITEEILEKFQAVIFEQAENRLHVQKAIVEALIKNRVQ
jgi:ornithine carbamoyltransferase